MSYQYLTLTDDYGDVHVFSVHLHLSTYDLRSYLHG